MKILVTGGSGYIGSFIVEHLMEQGHEVAVPCRDLRRGWKPAKISVTHLFQGDLLEPSFVRSIIETFRPQTVIHAAWEGTGRKDRNAASQVNNLRTMGNLLNATVEAKIDRFIGIGTQAEYGVYNTRIDEDVWPNPMDGYGVCKLAAGLAGKQFARTHGFRYAWLRLFSSFGPRDHADFFLPYVIGSLLKGEAPRLTACDQMWDYLYVKDVARLVGKVVESAVSFCDIFNLCSGSPARLKDAVMLVRVQANSGIMPEFGAVPYAHDGLFHLEGDNTKFKKTFGWVELTDMQSAICETVEWFRAHGGANQQSAHG